MTPNGQREPAGGGHAWVDGALTPRSEARVSVDDFGARYGAACFETMLARSGRIFRLEAHLERLEAGLAGLRVEAPARVELANAIEAVLEANELAGAGSRASVRLSVSAGRGGAPDLRAAHAPAVVVTADPAPAAPGPARLRVVSVRVDERRPLAGAKTANFLPYLLARAEAQEAGADDALLLNHAGMVAEAATANLFAWIDGVVATPPPDDGPLPGATRAAVMEVAREAGLSVAERTLRLEDLAQAEAVALTSSVQGIRAVAAIDAAPPEAPGSLSWRAPEGSGVLIERVSVAYERLVARECGEAS